MSSLSAIQDRDSHFPGSVGIFLPNAVCAAACAIVVALAGFSWLRAELPVWLGSYIGTLLVRNFRS